MTSEISTFLWNQWYFYLIYGHYNNSTLNYYLLVVGGGMLAVSADRLTVDTDTQALASAHSDPQPSVTDGFLACNWLNSPVFELDDICTLFSIYRVWLVEFGHWGSLD